ncbi:uncharacterized protein LOC6575008 [Drosophila mojavensis]|uniref:Kinesin motor domain-containing protein n=1 Tax=Drosophila mojavensis TaxID=7230 RepID=B4K8B1_DROMO|nr:uncharacterized protein LOC6575008 [Drosophila mojavensis]EDW16493.1 uncharacterized protein Dmoj_GI10568 [Drosophila mojavensis]
MGDKVHRVIVSLTDTMHKLSSSNKNTPIDSDVKLMDKTTLLLRTRNGTETSKSARYYHQLQFDAVGYEDDRHMRLELSDMLEQMIRQQRPGCMLRLTPRRSHNIKLLTHLLVSDLDKILAKLPYQLLGINVEYYDVRKFDMVNMLLNSHRSRAQSSKRTMQTTREMFQWLHNEYAVLRSRATGDDHINVEFVLADGVNKSHQLFLSIYNIFDCTDRTDINDFFKALSEGRRSKSTLLTDCIKESFDPKRPTRTLITCEMPLDKESTCEIHKFLHLANLVYSSIGASHENTDTPKAVDSKIITKVSSTSSSSHSMESCKQPSQLGLINIPFRARPLNLSHEDYSKLASWYHRIDTKFSEVKLSMERHYNVQYRQKFLKMCKQLNSYRILNDKSGGDAHGVLMKNSSRDLVAAANYAEALKQFRQLEREVKRCQFSPTLTTYMSTKNYELLNAEEALQQQEITNLREHRSRI